MHTFDNFNNIISVITHFSDNATCKKFLVKQRWGDDIVCPYCGKHHCYSRSDGSFRCPNCGKNFSVLVGTIFENTKVSLTKWFAAMYYVSSHKKGVSSYQIARDIHVTQKTAWYMLQKIRTLCVQDFSELSSDVECDEAYIGGRESNKHESKKTEGTQGRSLKTKTPIFGMVERGGKLVAQKVDDAKGETLSPIIRRYVKAGSRIFTDEYIGYRSLYDSEYTHSVIHHNDKEYCLDDIHTNTIEGFWGHFKRMIFGIYHFVSAKHLQRYVDEVVYRYNTRKQSEGKRFVDMFEKTNKIVRYSDVRMAA